MADQQLPGTMIVDGPQDPWEAALAKYQQALVDLDGDGIPDGVMTPNGQVQPLNNDIRRAISQQALAGREPTVDMARVGQKAQTREENNQAVEEGVGSVLLGQPVKAVNAMMEAAGNPSLANVTNAGVQSALIVPTFRGATVAGGVLGGGMLEAARRDYGVSPIDSAAAQAKSGSTSGNGYSKQELQSIAETVNLSAPALATMTRRQIGKLMENAGNQRITTGTEAEMNKESERKRAVLAAETKRDEILARDRRFSDTDMGKIYDKVGPGVVAAGAGGAAGYVSKLATPRGNAMYDYVLPGGLGALAGAKAYNAPLEFNAFSTEPDNQRRLAMETYAQMLPPGDPNKERVLQELQRGDYGGPRNKLQEDALKEYNDTLFVRSLAGAASGAGGGIMGAEFARAPGRVLEGIVEMPGRISQAYKSGFTPQAKPSTASSPLTGGPGGAGGGNVANYPQQPQPALPNPAAGGIQPPAPMYATYDPATHGASSRQLLDDLLSNPSGSAVAMQPERLAQLAQVRHAIDGSPMVDPSQLLTRARGSAEELALIDQLLRSGQIRRTVSSPEARPAVLNAATGRDYTLALPMAGGAALAAGPVNDMLNYYQGQ